VLMQQEHMSKHHEIQQLDQQLTLRNKETRIRKMAS
jgi:hypothetical protein